MTPRSLWAVWDAHLPDSPEQSLCGHTPATAGPQVGRPRGPRGQSPRPVHGQWTLLPSWLRGALCPPVSSRLALLLFPGWLLT